MLHTARQAAQISQMHTLQRCSNTGKPPTHHCHWVFLACLVFCFFTFVHRCCCHFAFADISSSVNFSALIFTFFKNYRTVALFLLLKVGTAYERWSPNLEFSIYVCITCVGYFRSSCFNPSFLSESKITKSSDMKQPNHSKCKWIGHIVLEECGVSLLWLPLISLLARFL